MSFKSPVYNVLRVPIDKVKANDYNPNSVAPPEMALLEKSIWEDGYTQPVVTVYDTENDMYIVVDGFHRYMTLKNSQRIFDREEGHLLLSFLISISVTEWLQRSATIAHADLIISS